MNSVHSSTSRTILVGLAALVVFTALVLVAMNAYMQQGNFKSSSKMAGSLSTSQDTYQQGYEAAKLRFSAICPQLNEAVMSLSGSVKSAGSKSIVVSEESLAVDPIADGISKDRTVQLAANGKVILMKEKDADQFNKESEAFAKLSVPTSPQATLSQPPSRFTETNGALSDIKVGMTVTVESDKDLRLLSTINASVIRVIVK